MNLSILQTPFAPQIPTECANLACDPNFSSSLGIFLLALGASEFVVYLVCRWMAYYANNAFYSQSLEWIHSDTTISPENEQEDITEALDVSEYAFSCREVSEPCCPICLIDYEKDDRVAHGKCRHSFHEDCLVQWLTKHSSCPCCRECILQKKGSPSKPDESLPYEVHIPRWLTYPYPEASSNDPAFFMFMF